MSEHGLLRRLGSWSHDRRWLVLVLWIAALVLGNVVAGGIGDAYRQEFLLDGLESGLATAVLFDASIVRMLLVPATMELLGDRNWWLPRWLDRHLPHLDVEGPITPPAPSDDPSQPDAAPRPDAVPVSVGVE